jgi:hypothetical protein
VIRLGLRLAVAGGREAIARLALIVIAVAIGVGLLLSTLAGLNAVNAQNARYAWLETGHTGANPPSSGSPTTKQATDPLWWLLRADYYQGKVIGRVDVAATGANSPVPRASPGSLVQVSSTRRRPWPSWCARHPPRSSATGFRVTWWARSARPRSPRLTRL